MIVNLKELVIGIHAGYSFRNKVSADEGGDLSVIQMKNVNYNNCSVDQPLTLIASGRLKDKITLMRNDILFVAKGAKNCAIEYVLDIPNAVASSAFFILRPDQSKIIPAYLAWYINQPPVQQYLKENVVGTYTPIINKSVIEGITIALPERAIQERIATIDRLRRKEFLLKELISKKREMAINALLLDLAAKQV